MNEEEKWIKNGGKLKQKAGKYQIFKKYNVNSWEEFKTIQK